MFANRERERERERDWCRHIKVNIPSADRQLERERERERERDVCVLFEFRHFFLLWELSLGPVVNILAILSNANILKKNKRIEIFHIKGIGCSLLISINIDIFDQRSEK